MNKDFGALAFAAWTVAIFLAMCIVVFYSGSVAGKQSLRREAIENGVAFYSVDPQTGKTTFEWKANP